MADQDAGKRAAGAEAATRVRDGMTVGLGSGSTVAFFLDALAARIRAEELTVGGVPTSDDTASKARELGIPLTGFDRVSGLDLAVDGADEVSPEFHMIKGGGGALLREKIVLAASAWRVIIADASKRVPVLGKFPLPVEVVPFGHQTVMSAIAATGAAPALRMSGAAPFVSDNGNYILDCAYGEIGDPAVLARALDDIPGVVETGLFVGLLDELIIGDGEKVEVVVAGARSRA